jgi:hypothetical protein
VLGAVRERQLARAGDEVRDPGHAAAFRSQWSLPVRSCSSLCHRS